MPRGVPKVKPPQGALAPNTIVPSVALQQAALDPKLLAVLSTPVVTAVKEGKPIPVTKSPDNVNTGIRTSSGGSLKILYNSKYSKVLLSDDEATLEFDAKDALKLVESLKAFILKPI